MSEPSPTAAEPSSRRAKGFAERKQLMLAILASRSGHGTVLSPDEERLVDDWLAGRLPSNRADAALELVRGNVLAAERVLEQRLLVLASKSAPPSKKVEASILKARAAAVDSAMVRRLRPSLWKWPGIAAATLAVALVMTVVIQSPPPTQATITAVTDLRSLIQAADVQVPPSEERAFKDVEVPMKVLQRLRRKAALGTTLTYREIAPYITGPGPQSRRPLRIIVDSALVKEIGATVGRPSMTIRVYDLENPRLSELRSRIAVPPSDRPAYLLTIKPSY